MSKQEFIASIFKKAQKTLDSFCENKEHFKTIEEMASLMAHTLKNGGKIISCGNGGSLCDATHFAEELSGRYKKNRPSTAAISITDSGHLTCVANDYGFDFVFSRFVEGLGKKDDLLLAISTSGQSKNVINAVHASKLKGMKSVSLLGKDGGELKNLSDLSLIVESHDTERIQEIHIKVIHVLIELIESELFPTELE